MTKLTDLSLDTAAAVPDVEAPPFEQKQALPREHVRAITLCILTAAVIRDDQPASAPPQKRFTAKKFGASVEDSSSLRTDSDAETESTLDAKSAGDGDNIIMASSSDSESDACSKTNLARQSYVHDSWLKVGKKCAAAFKHDSQDDEFAQLGPPVRVHAWQAVGGQLCNVFQRCMDEEDEDEHIHTCSWSQVGAGIKEQLTEFDSEDSDVGVDCEAWRSVGMRLSSALNQFGDSDIESD